MEKPKKYFTPEEAAQTLPLVKRIVGDLLETGRRIQNLSLSSQERDASVSEAELNRYLDLLDELFEELEALGCSYKDWNFSMGLVDFPSILNGREVLLCWRSDEPGVLYYHEVDAGYAGRKPLPHSPVEAAAPASGE